MSTIEITAIDEEPMYAPGHAPRSRKVDQAWAALTVGEEPAGVSLQVRWPDEHCVACRLRVQINSGSKAIPGMKYKPVWVTVAEDMLPSDAPVATAELLEYLRNGVGWGGEPIVRYIDQEEAK